MSKFIKDTSNTKIVSGIKIECAYRENSKNLGGKIDYRLQ